MSRVEQDAVLASVLRAVAAPPPRRRYWLAFVPTAAAAALLLVWFSPPRAQWTARGGAVATFRPWCAASASGRCKIDETLVFDVHAPSDAPYFAAFARSGTGDIIWYFPSPAERAIDTRGHSRGGLLDAGIPLATAHGFGRYDIYGLFSSEPLTRDEVKARVEADERSIEKHTVWIE